MGLVLADIHWEVALVAGNRSVAEGRLAVDMAVSDLRAQVRILAVGTGLGQVEEGLFVDLEVGIDQVGEDRVVEDILDQEGLDLVVVGLVAEGTVLVDLLDLAVDLLGLVVVHPVRAVVVVEDLYRHFLASSRFVEKSTVVVGEVVDQGPRVHQGRRGQDQDRLQE